MSNKYFFSVKTGHFWNLSESQINYIVSKINLAEYKIIPASETYPFSFLSFDFNKLMGKKPMTMELILYLGKIAKASNSHFSIVTPNYLCNCSVQELCICFSAAPS